MGGPHNKDTRLKWDTEPGLTSALLNAINNNPGYRDSLFGTKGDRWVAERDVALEVLRDEPWMIGKEEAGIVRRNGDKWEATSAWTSGVTHPVRNRLNVLAKRMESDYYADRFNIDPHWTSESDLPEDLKRDFHRYIPYYFVLRALTASSSRVRRLDTVGSASTSAGAEHTPSAASKSASKGKGKEKQDVVGIEVDGEEEEEDLDLAEGAVSGALSDDGSDVLYPELNSLAPTLDASQAGPSSSSNNPPRVNEGEDELDASQPVVVKKKRGRPIGSTNKKKLEENVPKRGRGRPRKNPLPESEPAPKGEEVDELEEEDDMGPVAVSIAHLAAYAAASASRAEAASASGGGPSTASGSAPKIEPTATTPAFATTSTFASATVPADASTSASGSGSVPAAPPVKRKRGRPLGSRTKRPDPSQVPSVPAVKRKPGRPSGAKDKKPRRTLVTRMLSESPPPGPGAPMCP